jgi:hypothetical protein
MNTNGLAKHYAKLTPLERVPLLIAAEARGDEAEFSRLKSSAPRRCFAISDHADLIDRLFRIAYALMMLQLDLTAWYWQVSEIHAEHSWMRDDEGDDPMGDRLMFLERLAAYCFLVNADAWQRFCGELSIDKDALLRDSPGYDTVKRMEENARLLACSHEEAAAYVRQLDPQAEVRTVEHTVGAMQAALKQPAMDVR